MEQLMKIPKIIETVRAELSLGDSAVAELKKQLIDCAVQRDRKQTFDPESSTLVVDLKAAGLIEEDGNANQKDVTEYVQPPPKKQKVRIE